MSKTLGTTSRNGNRYMKWMLIELNQLPLYSFAAGASPYQSAQTLTLMCASPFLLSTVVAWHLPHIHILPLHAIGAREVAPEVSRRSP
jgi:hypothetical protein